MIDFDKFDKYFEQAEFCIRALTDIMEGMREIKTSVDAARKAQEWDYKAEQQQTNKHLTTLCRQLEKIGLPKVDAEELRKAYLREKLFSDEWPKAVDPDILLNSSQVQEARAEQILEILVTDNFKNMMFLDFGCGEGYVTVASAKQGTKLSVGYDIENKWTFENKDNYLFTQDWNKVKELSPYDIVLLFDVLDHVQDPVETLINIRRLLSDRGRVYLQCHPWSSRHGGHLYDKLNKAFVHLILDSEELTRLGFVSPVIPQKVKQPLKMYRKWFEEAGYSIQTEIPITEPIEDYFLNDMSIQDCLQKHWPGEPIASYASISVVDYIIEPIQSNNKVF